ncbi:hypothetical protein GWI33_022888 [Rhynchophorus ferrugineus]|uniref:Ionotropic receptor n=1 Tax=Rhynchophorus ferrugineus TaxID=354439 RepID=A0A834IMK8_RHYFE|nr:hypothetical protein GWI33_022888 [Rhynchophorus ferrugineus]
MKKFRVMLFFILSVIIVKAELKLPEFTSCFMNKNGQIYEKFIRLGNGLKLTRVISERNVDYSVQDCAHDFLELTQRSFLKTSWIKDKLLNYAEDIFVHLEDNVEVTDIKYPVEDRFLYNVLPFTANVIQVMFAEDSHMFYRYFSEANRMTIFSRARQLHILIFTSSKFNLEHVGGLLVYLWHKYSIINVFAHNPLSKNHSDDFFIYKPFVVTSKGYGQVQIHHASNILNSYSVFTNNVINLHKYPMKISIFERYPTAIQTIPFNMRDQHIYDKVHDTSGYYGSDGVIISELASYMNFSIDSSMISKFDYYGRIAKNGTALGSLGQVVRREIDLQANARFYTDTGIQSIEYSILFDFDKICVLVPKSAEVPKWVKLYRIFWNPLIVVVMFVFMLCGLINAVLQRNIHRSFSEVFLEIYSIALGLSYSSVLRSNATLSRRIFLASCMLFFIVISTLLTAAMFKSYSTTIFLPEINTLEELDESGLIIKSSLDIFQDCSTKLHRKLSKKIDRRWSNVSALDLAIKTKHYAGFERQHDAELKIHTDFTSADGTPQLHIVPECPSSFYMGYILPRGSPYLPTVNVVLQRFLEGGLILKWYSDFQCGFVIQARIRRERRSRKKFVPFNLEDMQSAFFILVIGYVLSLCVFITELFWQKNNFERMYLI